MIVKVFREPTDSIMRLYGQPVLLHDVLIVGKLSSVIPPITDDASINAKIDLDPDLPPEVVALCKSRPLYVREFDSSRQIAQAWDRYRFRLASPPDDSIRLEYVMDEVPHDID